MFRSIMVPLDRSPFAEQALPLALSIAQRARAHLDLVEVHSLYGMDDPAAGWAPYDAALDDQVKHMEQKYLDDTARRLASLAPVRLGAAVLRGSSVLPETVADSLIKRARSEKADLIVMATHAPGLLGRFLVGNVGDELIRRAPAPVLLVRPGDGPPGPCPALALEDVLVALDGSPLAELALAPAVELARLMQARCTLLRAVGVGAQEQDEAEQYLVDLAPRVREHALAVRTRVVVGGAAEAILEEANALKGCLVALATHGRGGLTRMLFGSVADQVVRGASSPALVCRPQEPPPGPS